MKGTKLQHNSSHDWLKMEESWRPRSKEVEFKAGWDVARKKKGQFDSDQQSPSRRMNICLKKRVKGKRLKKKFSSTCFKSFCSKRMKESTWSGSSFCNFKSLPGLVLILSFPILPLLLSLSFTSIQKAQVMQHTVEPVWSANVRCLIRFSWRRENTLIHCSSSYFHPPTQIFIIEYILKACENTNEK